MKVVLLKTESRLEQEIIDNQEFEYCTTVKEIPREAIVIYADTHLNQALENQLITAVAEKEITVLRANILRNKAYIGPIYKKNSRTIFDFIEQSKRNDRTNELSILRDYKSELIDDRETELFLKATAYTVMEQLDQIKKGRDKENALITLAKEGLIKKEHVITKKDKYKKEIFDEHLLFSKPRLKRIPTVHRTKSKIDVEHLKSKMVDFEYGICKHTFLDLNSRFIPMVSAENHLFDGDENNSFGRANTFDGSLQSALLESLERNYNAFSQQGRTEIYGSYNELKEKAVHPSVFILHTEEQYMHKDFNFRKYNDDLKVNWVWCWSIKKEEYVLIPEQFVHYYDNGNLRKENRYIYDTSNGAALGGNLEEGLLYGLFETIERDNFLVSFYNQEQLVQIDIDKSELKDLSLMKEYLQDKGYELYFFDITKELRVPAVWCLLVNTNEDAVVTTYSAAGCNFDPEKAIESAYIEVISSVPVYEELFKEEAFLKRRELIIEDVSKLTQFEDHVLYYSHKKALANYDYLFDKTITKSVAELYPEWYKSEKYKNHDLNKDIQTLNKEILAHYDDIYVADLSSQHLKELGFSCAKVLVPGMQVVTFGMQNERINYDRLVKNTGNEKQTTLSINKNPHPFP